jgi:hypothetical protein
MGRRRILSKRGIVIIGVLVIVLALIVSMAPW